MIIYLIGYMGVGKSTIAKALAQQLKYPVLDIDDIIASLEGKKIDRIFEELGEPYFRALEKRILNGVQHLTRAVIATGGGLPCADENMETMKASGITVYLKASTSFLHDRLKDTTDRPIIEKNKAHLFEFIENQLETRSKYYELASITVDAEQTVEAIVKDIQSQLE